MAAGPITRTCSLAALALLAAAAPAYAQGDSSIYVRARAADAAGFADQAAAGYAIALVARPDDPILAMRAYRQAMAAGDYALASKAAAILAKSGNAPGDTAILGFAVALQAGDRPAAEIALKRIAASPLNFLAPTLEAWMALDRGEDPMPALERARSNPLAGRYAANQRPLLMIAAGRGGDAMIALATLLNPTDGDDEDLRIDAAMLLAATGAKDRAKPLLAGDRPEYAVLRKQLGKGVKGNAAFGASRLFLAVARDISGQDIADLSILVTRAALLLDPADDRARLYLAVALSKRDAHDLALAELARIGPRQPFYRDARAGRIAALQHAGRTAEALAAAQSLSDDRRGTAMDARTYGDILAADGQFAAAAAAYKTALSRAPGDGGWELHYLQGSALERAGRWGEALPALRRAVDLGPDQPVALEYLGYAQVLRGEDLTGAQALLERASALKPADSSIADSLAWAYFTRGDTARALPLLEQAARTDPGGPQVNEHLGDAYWRLGRRYEARYAWNAASVYADSDAAVRIEAKLANGLQR